jgi:hypothetical protein
LGLISDAEEEGRLDVVESMYFGETETMKTKWWSLCESENEIYLQIVTGDKNISYFDVFVNKWKTGGGNKITKEVNSELSH